MDNETALQTGETTREDGGLMKPTHWRCADGNKLAIAEMETSHLISTLRMLWNHCAPPRLYITPVRLHRFDRKLYNDEYLTGCIAEIFHELNNIRPLCRTDEFIVNFIAHHVHEISDIPAQRRQRFQHDEN